MSTILDKIVAQTQADTAARKKAVPVAQLEKMPHFSRPTFSLKEALLAKEYGVIAEFKRRSPSKGLINGTVQSQQVVPAYLAAGAAACSVLTDAPFFGGSLSDLLAAREVANGPLLRKDFTLDEYHVIEAKAFGADAILLIAAILTPKQIRELTLFAKSLNLSVLLEVHDEEELLRSVHADAEIIGVNNRNLKTFEVSIETSLNLLEQMPVGAVKVSESGISQTSTIRQLKQAGYQGFLIGENFMKTDDPGKFCQEFLQELR